MPGEGRARRRRVAIDPRRLTMPGEGRARRRRVAIDFRRPTVESTMPPRDEAEDERGTDFAGRGTRPREEVWRNALAA